MPRFWSAIHRVLGLSLCWVNARPLGVAASSLGAPTRLACREVDIDELVQHAADPELELNPTQIRLAAARGDVVLGSFDGERLVGYLFLAFGPTPHTNGIVVHFPAGCRYSYKKFVRPEYRGRRVAHQLSALADAPEYRRGCRHAVNFVLFETPSSQRATVRGGSVVVGYAGYVSWGDLVLAFRSPGARRFGFGFEGPGWRMLRGKPEPLSHHGR